MATKKSESAASKKTPAKSTRKKKSPRHSEATVMRAVMGSHGIVSTVATALGLSWQGAKNAIERYEATKAAMTAEREKVVDVAESRLMEAVNAGEAWAIRFYLNNQAKPRGYGWKNLAIASTDPPKVIGLYAEDSDLTENPESDSE